MWVHLFPQNKPYFTLLSTQTFWPNTIRKAKPFPKLCVLERHSSTSVLHSWRICFTPHRSFHSPHGWHRGVHVCWKWYYLVAKHLHFLVDCPNGTIVSLNETVPWLQGESVKLVHILKMKSPRVFKTHDYWNWIPKKLRKTARFIYCSRNPKDRVVSYF